MSADALLAAVHANPDDDTPRLVYADWLDEHGDPDRAELIRVQCRLADLSPAADDWVTLTERQDELFARLKNRYRELWPAAAGAFYLDFKFADEDAGTERFRRGFPFAVTDQSNADQWTADRVRERADLLTELFTDSSVRGVEFYGVRPADLADLLDRLPAGGLRMIEAGPVYGEGDEDAVVADFARVLATHPGMGGVQDLTVRCVVGGRAADELARATALGAVRRLGLRADDDAGTRRVLDAGWCGRLTDVSLRFPGAEAVRPLGDLPHLHTLHLQGAGGAVPAVIAAGRFPALARLHLDARAEATAAIAGGRFPELRVLHLRGGMKAAGLTDFLKADWFGQLRVFDLAGCDVGDRGGAALAEHPVAKSLRVLRLRENVSGGTGLKAIATGFPALTTLDLRAFRKRRATPADVERFAAALAAPGLRHLDLHGWPLGEAGAIALANNPSLANLTRLSLDSCGIGDRGAAAVIGSPYLQNLVELTMSYNAITTGADALADPGVLPQLGECWLSANDIPPASAERIKAARRYVII